MNSDTSELIKWSKATPPFEKLMDFTGANWSVQYDKIICVI